MLTTFSRGGDVLYFLLVALTVRHRHMINLLGLLLVVLQYTLYVS